jgi:hypothetical protein
MLMRVPRIEKPHFRQPLAFLGDSSKWPPLAFFTAMQRHFMDRTIGVRTAFGMRRTTLRKREMNCFLVSHLVLGNRAS